MLRGVVKLMPNATAHDLKLSGCMPEPLMSYLKALGILRLVSEQKDPEARGWWKDDVFWLRSPGLFKDADTEEAKRIGLIKFFLEEYKPTPIVGPWSGGSGFFKKDNKMAVEELAMTTNARVGLYADVIRHVQAILKEMKIYDKPKDDDKSRLIRRYRSELPEQVVAWMDAVMVIQDDGQGFAPLLGTGGNDGRLDFTQNFMQRIVSLNLHQNAVAEQSLAWLKQTMFSVPTILNSTSVGQFAPGRAGGPNATQGMEGDSTDNPWDFLLMMEGAILVAGAPVRRFGMVESARIAFPFTVRAVAVGFDSAAPKDDLEMGQEAKSRGELWLPLWNRPTTCQEIRHLFGEGRAEVFGRPARDGTDFARAVAVLGVDRGISGFNRLTFLKRSGKAFLAAPIGRFEVRERREADLLREIDTWLNSFRFACSAKETPPRFVSALRSIESAIFEFCKYGGKPLFQDILVALGKAERELALTAGKEGLVGKRTVSPLHGLSPDWIEAADDGSSEFAIARALVSVYDPEGKIGPLRANMEPIDWRKHCRTWADKDRTVVWNAANLATNLVNILQRRVMDGARAGCEHSPIASRSTAPLDTISAFLYHRLDDLRIENLVWGLMLIADRGSYSRGGHGMYEPLPRAYALLKLLFLPWPLVIERADGGMLSAHLQRKGEPGAVTIRPEPSVLLLLRGGRLGEACAIAMRRLRGSGFVPMPGHINGRVRDDDWLELDRMGGIDIHPRRLAAALLIPINDNDMNKLVRLVIGGAEMNYDQTKTPAATNQEGGMT